MKLLRGKCKEEFENYFYDRYSWFSQLREIDDHGFLKELEDLGLLEQVIIDYFDLVGIYINVNCISVDGELNFAFSTQQDNTLNDIDEKGIISRQQVNLKSIMKANEIRNSQLAKP